MFKDEIAKAKILTEALPYIKRFQGQTIVIKFGGSLMTENSLKTGFAADIALLRWAGINPVIVHGGGKEISSWLKKVGKEAVFIDGLRYTDAEAMEITEMVLCGKIRGEIISLLNRAGVKAVGLSGKDANLFIAKRIRGKEGQDLGFVGDIVETDPSILHTLCERGCVPVVSSIASGLEESTLNLNADYVAAGLAASLKAKKLIYLTDVQGLIVNEQLLQLLDLKEAEKLLAHPDLKGGMVPKLECCIRAIRDGVDGVHVISGSIEHAVLLELFTDTGIGTMIKRSKKK